MNPPSTPRALTIAGSDSGGGAGIQADLKTFTALKVYGMSVLTSITAQNTVCVRSVYDLPPEFVAQQIDAVVEDIGVDAAKTGMLSTAPIVEIVAERIAAHNINKLVVDPVMIAKSGDELLHESAWKAVVALILPLAYVVTPNIPEAEVMAEMNITDERSLKKAAQIIQAHGAQYVLIKGGHAQNDDAIDYLFDGNTFRKFSAPRIDTHNTHGTGCTLSAAITAYLARGCEVADAVERAKQYLTEAIRQSFDLGHGHGPLNHFWPVQ